MNNSNSTVWGNISRLKQPTWATKALTEKMAKVNATSLKGLNKSKLAAKIMPTGDYDDPLFTDRNIRKYGTDIYFLDAIDDESQLILQQMLKQCVAEFLADHIQDILMQNLNDSITIYINSPGGYAYSGLALYDFIKEIKVPVRCVINGECASAATLIFLACDKREMSDNSCFLMHQCSWGDVGDNRYMQDQAENSRKLMAQLRKIYMDETNIGKEYTDEKEREAYIQSILEHDRYFSKEECKQLGILSEEDEDEPLSEESLAKLNEFAQKLFEQEQKEKSKSTKKTNKKADKKAEEKVAEEQETKATKKAPAKKSKATDKKSK
jgi:ATP-dependent protease ClpP protease subunit